MLRILCAHHRTAGAGKGRTVLAVGQGGRAFETNGQVAWRLGRTVPMILGLSISTFSRSPFWRRVCGRGGGGLMRMLTWANLITTVRLVAAWPIWLLLQDPKARAAAFVTMVAVGLTDVLDGAVARRLGQQSRFGAMLDPVADKVLAVAVLHGLWTQSLLPGWLVAALAVKELLQLAVGAWLVRSGRRIPQARASGKAATFVLIVGICGITLGLGLGLLLVYVGVGLSLAAGIDYLSATLRLQEGGGREG